MAIQQLQYILQVQRTGSISQAAKHFLASHSCVSSTISTMEEEMGFPGNPVREDGLPARSAECYNEKNAETQHITKEELS